MKKIYTIGTSNRQAQDFIEILKFYEISLLVDVRRFPTSKLEHFKKKNLEKLCRMNGIDYRWLGDLLGGYRTGGYEAYRNTLSFQNGLIELKALAQKVTTAFCCAEKFPWKCHRRFIANKLKSQGWSVIHILEKNKTWSKQQLDLFE